MVNIVGVQIRNTRGSNSLSFGKQEETKRSECENKDVLMYDEKRKHPITTNLKIQSDKFIKAFT